MKTLFLAAMIAMAPVHKFYVSLTEIRYNVDQHSLEISSKIFIDDLAQIFPANKIEKEEDLLVDELLETYVLENLNIEINKKKMDVQYIGYEIEADVVWCYLEATEVEYPKNVSVEYSILLDTFDKQTNIVHFDLEKNIQSLFLTTSSRVGELVF